jgi:hypothetical protein
VWTQAVFWQMWCDGDNERQCEDRWLAVPQTLQNVAKCLMAMQIGRLAALTLGKCVRWCWVGLEGRWWVACRRCERCSCAAEGLRLVTHALLRA